MALLTAVGSGYQGAMLAPTEVLAEQHMRKLGDLLARLPEVSPRRTFFGRCCRLSRARLRHAAWSLSGRAISACAAWHAPILRLKGASTAHGSASQRVVTVLMYMWLHRVASAPQQPC